MSCNRCNKPNNPCHTCDNGCLKFESGRCLLYGGPDTDYLQVPTGLNYDKIVQGLDSTIADIQDQIDELNLDFVVKVQDSPTTQITGDGVHQPINVNVKLSKIPGNAIKIDNEGLYVLASSGQTGSIALSSDGVQLSYSFVHNINNPTGVLITPSSPESAGYSYATITNTNVTIHYDVAPPVGVNNLKYFYSVY